MVIKKNKTTNPTYKLYIYWREKTSWSWSLVWYRVAIFHFTFLDAVIKLVPRQVQVSPCTTEHNTAVAALLLLNPQSLCEHFSCHLCAALDSFRKSSMLKPSHLYLPSHGVTQIALTSKCSFIFVIACLCLSNLFRGNCEKALLGS